MEDFKNNQEHISTPVWNGNACIVQLEFPNTFPDTLEKNGNTLLRKPEFHITLIGNQLASEIENHCTEDQRAELKEYINSIQLHVTLANNEYFLVKDYGDHIRYSRIVELLLNEKDELEKHVSQIIGFPYTIFPHITTHSGSDHEDYIHRGIGIQSREELEQYQQ
ncbi:hypothetical protein KC866_03500 [Patescibacteria group bacterium]|nr:hypothetical protein [Patescibacteria group bacterium]